jgi:hypothetical protein
MSTTQVYAERRGLEWHSRLRLPCPGSHGGGTALGWGASVGEIAGTRQGALYTPVAGRGMGPPTAQFAIPGLEQVIDRLWVRRSGRSILTRAGKPKGYTDLALDNDAYTARYRVAIGSRRDEPAARQLLDGDFTEWHLTHGHQGNQLSNAGSFELTAGVVLISGAGDEFESDATTDEFAQFVKEFAARVASIAPEHAHA